MKACVHRNHHHRRKNQYDHRMSHPILQKLYQIHRLNRRRPRKRKKQLLFFNLYHNVGMNLPYLKNQLLCFNIQFDLHSKIHC